MSLDSYSTFGANLKRSGETKDSEKEKAERALGRSDYLEFWLEEANVAVTANLLAPTEALSIVKNCFGEDWLRSLNGKKNKVSFPISNSHLLGEWIATPNFYQIHCVLELATILKSVVTLPRFDQVLKIMRSKEQFETALMQIAFAHRLIVLGAGGIELEPPTDDGRVSDILFKYKNQVYIMECYSPQIETENKISDLCNFTLDRISNSARHFNKRIAIKVVLKSEAALTCPDKTGPG